MIALTPGKWIFIGFVLVVIGVALPLLMVLKLIPSTFFLNFLAFIASVLGLIMGMYGSAMYVHERRGKK